MLRASCLVVAAMLAAAPAWSQSSTDPLDTRVFKNGFWVGGGVSWSNLEVDGTSFDDDAFGYNVGIGYQFANYFGINAKWRDLGGFESEISPGSGDVDGDVDGYTVGLTAGVPVSGRIAVIGGAGYYDFDVEGSQGGGSASDSDSGLYLNAGVASEVGRIVIQPGVMWYDVDDGDLWSLELNFYWKIEAGN